MCGLIYFKKMKMFFVLWMREGKRKTGWLHWGKGVYGTATRQTTDDKEHCTSGKWVGSWSLRLLWHLFLNYYIIIIIYVSNLSAFIYFYSSKKEIMTPGWLPVSVSCVSYDRFLACVGSCWARPSSPFSLFLSSVCLLQFPKMIHFACGNLERN